MSPIDLYTTIFVAMAKRGNVSDDFMTKIEKGLEDDLQLESRLNSDVIRLVYKFYGGHVNESNASDIVSRWLEDIPEVALRVRLTLEQATNSGLTAFVVIDRAMIKYPNFNWARLNVQTGSELTNFTNAAALINGNPNYGFKKSLGAAKSTSYSSIAFVAKELLITLNWEISFKTVRRLDSRTEECRSDTVHDRHIQSRIHCSR